MSSYPVFHNHAAVREYVQPKLVGFLGLFGHTVSERLRDGPLEQLWLLLTLSTYPSGPPSDYELNFILLETGIISFSLECAVRIHKSAAVYQPSGSPFENSDTANSHMYSWKLLGNICTFLISVSRPNWPGCPPLTPRERTIIRDNYRRVANSALPLAEAMLASPEMVPSLGYCSHRIRPIAFFIALTTFPHHPGVTLASLEATKVMIRVAMILYRSIPSDAGRRKRDHDEVDPETPALLAEMFRDALLNLLRVFPRTEHVTAAQLLGVEASVLINKCNALARRSDFPLDKRCHHMCLLATYFGEIPYTIEKEVSTAIRNTCFFSLSVELTRQAREYLAAHPNDPPIIEYPNLAYASVACWMNLRRGSSHQGDPIADLTPELLESKAISEIAEWTFSLSIEESQWNANAVMINQVFELLKTRQRNAEQQLEMGRQIAAACHRIKQTPNSIIPMVRNLWKNTLEVVKRLNYPGTSLCSVCSQPWSPTGEILLQCSKCKDRMYCSRACQNKDWKSHRGSCTAPVR